MERNENNIELRTSEIDAILGKSPNWIMRTGIGVICASVLILLVGSAFSIIRKLLVAVLI